MKKVILLVAAMAFLAGTVNAGPMAYIGLYTDEAHSNCSQNVFLYSAFTVWIWVLPDDNGMMCAEFQIINPYPTLFNTVTTPNPIHSVALGAPLSATGVSMCFQSCQRDWTWFYQMTFLPTAAIDPGFITIGPRPDAGAYQVADCRDKYPLAPLTILNHFAINQECVTGTEDASWGAIKGMYNE